MMICLPRTWRGDGHPSATGPTLHEPKGSATWERTAGRNLRSRLAAFALGLIATAIAFVPAEAHGPGRGRGGGGCCDYWQPGWMHRHMWGGPGANPEMRARMRRHRTYMHEGLPKAYRGATSTLEPTGENVETGGRLYTEHCASCHGKAGMGDGEAAKGLSPSPALLAHMIERPVSVDAYLLWTVSEGGERFGTAMPAFKNVLAKDEIWKIIAYMRDGFPKARAKP